MPSTDRKLAGRVRRVASKLAILLPIALLTTAAFGGSAQGAVGPCRSDPVVILSNLKTLDLSATVSDRQQDLQSVTYTMHLPPGVRPLVVVPTDGLVGQVEHFGYVNDVPAGTYSVDIRANTGATVPVTALALGVLIGSGTSTGVSNQDISISL